MLCCEKDKKITDKQSICFHCKWPVSEVNVACETFDSALRLCLFKAKCVSVHCLYSIYYMCCCGLICSSYLHGNKLKDIFYHAALQSCE